MMWKNISCPASIPIKYGGWNDVQAPRGVPLLRSLQPLCLRAAVCLRGGAARGAARAGDLENDRVDSRRDGGGEERGDGVQPRRGCPSRRAQPEDREPRAAARRDDEWRSDRVCHGGLRDLCRGGLGTELVVLILSPV